MAASSVARPATELWIAEARRRPRASVGTSRDTAAASSGMTATTHTTQAIIIPPEVKVREEKKEKEGAGAEAKETAPTLTRKRMDGVDKAKAMAKATSQPTAYVHEANA